MTRELHSETEVQRGDSDGQVSQEERERGYEASDAPAGRVALGAASLFGLLVVGLFGKIIVKKPTEIFLSTPLEFIIFLLLVFIAIIPHEIRDQYYLVPNTLRTFFLFLALKIVAMNWSERQAPAEAQTA